MKISKLLVLGMLTLFGVGQAKAVDGSIWTKPALPAVPEVTTFTTYQTDTQVYLYNVATHLFYTGGNNWGTRASLVSATNGDGNGATAGEAVKGAPVTFIATEAAINRGLEREVEGCLELKSYVWKFSGDRSTFAGGWNDVWVDNDTRDDRFWVVKAVGDSYRISNVNTLPDKCLGWNGDDLRLYLIDADAEGAAWKMVDADTYAAWEAALPDDMLTQLKNWLTAMDTYKSAQSLKETLDKAEEIGASVDDQIAVYNNTASVKDDLDKANTAAQTAIQTREKELEIADLANATAANPKPATSLITNPSYDNGKNDGWTTSPAPGFGYTAAEHYEVVFDTHQTISSMPKGVYALGLQAFCRPGGAQDGYKRWTEGDEQCTDTKLYVKVGDDTFTKPIVTPYPEAGTEKLGVGSESEVTTTTEEKIYIPNNMEAAEAYFVQTDRYHNKVFFDVADSTATIGLKNSTSVGSNWVLYDNWTLTYYGLGADAYQAWLDDAASQYTERTVAEGTVYTESYLPAYNAAVAAEKKATNREEVLAELKKLTDAQEALDNNIALWKDLTALKAKAAEYGKMTDYDEYLTQDLNDWVEFDSEDIFASHNLTNEALEETIAEVQGMIDALIRAPRSGADMTDLLKNPSFDNANHTEGWTGWKTVASQKWNDNKTLNMPVTGGQGNTCAEAFASPDFDLYQIVEGAPVGVYEISVQGFYRYGRGDNAWNWYAAQEDSYVKKDGSPVYVYLNSNMTPFQNIFGENGEVTNGQPEEFYASIGTNVDNSGNHQCYVVTAEDGTKTYFPDGMASASIAFADGMYTRSAYGVVAKDGDVMRIGVKGASNQTADHDSWVIFDNFKLTFRGYAKEHVKPVLEQAIAAAKQNVTEVIGKNALTAEQEGLKVAEAAVANADIDDKTMFDALSQLVDANGLAIDSKKIFAELVEANQELNKNVVTNTVAADATVTEAAALNAKISNGIEGYEFTDDEVPGLLKDIEDMLAKLAIPDWTKASDETPVECTTMIQNPAYASNEKTGWSGTEAGNVANHEAEMFNKDFDYYQDIENLEPGTYKLSLQGYYRAGEVADDYKLFIETPDSANNAFLYAVTADGTSSTPLLRLASEVIVQDAGVAVPAGWAAAKTDTIDAENNVYAYTVVPNNMAQAEVCFIKEDASYNYSGAEVIVKVGEDGKLRIGVKKEAKITNDWTIWTNWQLFYYGKNSTKEVTGDATVGIEDIASSAAVKTEFFTVGGAQVSKPGKGVVIMKQTLSDGSVKIRKIIVK